MFVLVNKKNDQKDQPGEKEPERLAFTKKEAAVLLGLSESTVHKLTLNGKIKCKRVGRRILYPMENLKEFLRAD